MNSEITFPAVNGFDFNSLHSLLHKELQRNPDSDGYLCSIRGLARLLDIGHSCLIDNGKQRNGLPKGILLRLPCWSLDECPESLKPVLGFDYKMQPYIATATTKPKYLPELVVQCVVDYYAKEARQKSVRAQRLSVLFGSMGVRSLFSQILGENEECEQQELILPSDTVLRYQEPLIPVQETLLLLEKLDALRLRRDEVVAVLHNMGLLRTSKRNTTYRGVVKHKNKWRAQISVNGSTKVIGSAYASAEDAAIAYDAYAKVVYGSKAKLNF